MITSVYLSNSNVCAVLGMGQEKYARVKKVWNMTLREGTLINGIIIDEAALLSQLKKFWNENQIPGKKVRLVLEGSRLITRRIDLPKMKKKQIYEALPKEFTDIEQQEETLYDYVAVPDASGKPQIKAVAAERRYVESFVRLFSGIGVHLESIVVGRNSLLRLLTSGKNVRGKNVIFQILDGNTMTSVLCLDGQAVYSTQRRIFAPEDGQQFAGEIIRSVSSLQQFQMTQKKEDVITGVYLAGVTEELLEKCREAVQEQDWNIQVSFLNLDRNIVLAAEAEQGGSFLFAVGGLMSGSEGTGLVRGAERKIKEKKDGSEVAQMMRLPVIILGGCILISGALYFSNQGKAARLAEQKGFLLNPENGAQAEAAALLEEQKTTLGQQIRALETLRKSLDSYPKIDSELIERLEDCREPGIDFAVTGYQGEKGTLTLRASAGDAAQISSFMDRLWDTGLLGELDYTGYEYEKETNTYRVDVSCRLAEQEEEQQTEEQTEEQTETKEAQQAEENLAEQQARQEAEAQTEEQEEAR